jgi:PHD/YefM family antitoxin component YafN of YafNO toxin-antitoxin module
MTKIVIMVIKENLMQFITASDIKRNSTLLQNALKDDLLVTKRDKPFVVIIDYERYLELITNANKNENQDWIEQSFGVMAEDEAQDLLDDIYNSRVNKKEIDLWS